ncbi:MAG: RNB domain-containing ribonuclease, partial [Deltaproteobacteria bacterium]|nr:RNB domain-containing ribonuclease [Deltaproteobacteria bacterium]
MTLEVFPVAAAGKNIRPGTVVEFFDKKKLVCAVCIGVKNERIQVLTESGRTGNVTSKRILHSSEAGLDISSGRENLQLTLKEIVDRRLQLMRQVSVAELWDLLQDEEEGFACEQLAELCFSEQISSDHTAAVLRALLDDAMRFKYKGGMFYPLSAERLEQIRLQQERQAQRERETAEGAAWLAAVWKGEEAKEPENRRRYIQMLKDYCLLGTEAPNYQQIKKLLNLAQVPQPHGPFQILVRLGIWSEDENLYLHRFGIQEEFPEEIAAAAGRIEVAIDVKEREDLSFLTVLTIDGPMTRDFDDALSVRFLDGRVEVGVHIADAAELIVPESILDEEALERATSLYLPDKRIPMLPEVLSEGVCSLRLGEERLALSLLAYFNQEDQLEEYRFALSRVKVKRQLTYSEANEMLAEDKTLGYLFRLCTRLRRQRIAAGALLLPLPEIRVWVNGSGTIHLNKIDRETPAQVIVSELMILANSLAAKELAARGVPAIYRSQDKPQEIVEPDASDELYRNYRQRRYLSRA